MHSLADNKIGSDGAQALAEALPHCTKLHTLECVRSRGCKRVRVKAY